MQLKELINFFKENLNRRGIRIGDRVFLYYKSPNFEWEYALEIIEFAGEAVYCRATHCNDGERVEEWKTKRHYRIKLENVNKKPNMRW